MWKRLISLGLALLLCLSLMPFGTLASEEAAIWDNVDEKLPDEAEVIDEEVFDVAEEPVIEEEPVAGEEPAAEEELAAEAEPAIEVAAVEEEPVAETEPVVKEETVAEEEPVVETVAVLGEEPVSEEEPVAGEEPSIEMEPAVEEELVIAEEPIAEEELAVEMEPAVEEELVIAEEPIAEEESAVEMEPAVEEEPVVAEGPISAEEPAVEEEPVVETESESEEGAEGLTLDGAGGVYITQSTFPDKTFRAYVLNYIDKDGNAVLSASEIAATKAIVVGGYSIGSLSGIEYFTALTDLICNDNLLTKLDLSGCKSLEYLSCLNNQLTSLNVSGCTALEYLDCHNNQLKTLDVSGCKKLWGLYCYHNQLTKLNVSGCDALKALNCNHNKLKTLSVSGYEQLSVLMCYDNRLTKLDLNGCAALAALSGVTPIVTADQAGTRYVDYDSGAYRLQYDAGVTLIYTSMSVASAKVNLSQTSYTYNGKAKKPKVTVKLNGVTLKKGTDYQVNYKHNKIGTATVIITGIGKYSGTKKVTFTIQLKGTSLSSVTNSAAGKLRIKWKKNTGVTGYQIQYSKYKDFSSASKVTIKKNKTTAKTVSKLMKGVTYFVRIRTYKKISGKTYYSPWSAVKMVRIKK